MLTEIINNTSVFTQEKLTFDQLVKKINEVYNDHSSNNIIVNLFSLSTISAQDLLEFLPLSNKHKEAKHSFVIVSKKVNIDDVDEALSIAPTQEEAFDIIGMEEIERDLGF